MSEEISLSIVIPAYNEENHLKACLDAIAKQAVKPRSVIVVDNNSTDNTAQIARKYSFVTLLQESRQHQSFAQATGFDFAQADIFARIDADSILPPNWVETVIDYFANNPNTVAITGKPDPYDIPFKAAGIFFFQLYHDALSRWQAGHGLLWGSNCAFRAKLWDEVKPKLHFRPDIWEDYDISFALAEYGRIDYVSSLIAGCSFRAITKSFLEQMSYHFRAVRTFKLNTSWWRTALQGLLRSTIVLLALLGIPYRLFFTHLEKYRQP